MAKKTTKPKKKPGGNRTAGTVPLYVDLPEPMDARLKQVMVEEGQSKRDVVVKALEHWFDSGDCRCGPGLGELLATPQT